MFTLDDSSAIRKINITDKKIFLTFDDGPGNSTEAVLEILKKYSAQATFFAIGKKAEAHMPLLKKTLAAGHSVYSHSIDHNYWNFFSGDKKIEEWVLKSISHLAKLTDSQTCVFRPPAGVLTPPLVRVCKKNRIYLVLWSHRFFDSTKSLTPQKVLAYLPKAQAGDIVLLHDQQKEKNKKNFLQSLELLVQELRDRGFQLCSLTEKDLAGF